MESVDTSALKAAGRIARASSSLAAPIPSKYAKGKPIWDIRLKKHIAGTTKELKLF